MPNPKENRVILDRLGLPPHLLKAAHDALAKHQKDNPPMEDFPSYRIFWGGADVDPSFYNRPRSALCGHADIKGDMADRREMEDAIDRGIPVIGICKGAQLLNVVNGGILVQHIEGHAIGQRHIATEVTTGIDMLVSSTHHQMMVAHKAGKILFTANEAVQGIHWNNVDEPYTYKHVNEVIYYPDTMSLCIQPHPEWMDQKSPFVAWINQFIGDTWGIPPINFETLYYEREM